MLRLYINKRMKGGRRGERQGKREGEGRARGERGGERGERSKRREISYLKEPRVAFLLHSN